MLRSEQETTFRWAADEDMVSIWTAQAPVGRKLEKAGYRPYRASREGGEVVGWFFRVPLSEFRWRARPRGAVSAARKAAGERLASATRTRKLPVNSQETPTRTPGDGLTRTLPAEAVLL
jgi:hypothetical protein